MMALQTATVDASAVDALADVASLSARLVELTEVTASLQTCPSNLLEVQMFTCLRAGLAGLIQSVW